MEKILLLRTSMNLDSVAIIIQEKAPKAISGLKQV
jgi:hypothetical protein